MMDPVTTSITAALAAGVAGGGPELVKKAISDAYEGIKSLLKEKFGHGSEVVNAVKNLEAKPDSEGRKGTLQEEIVAAKADRDPDLLKAAQSLLDQLKTQPEGTQVVQTAIGSNRVYQAAGGSTINVGNNQPKES
jgi:hypothetical protein